MWSAVCHLLWKRCSGTSSVPFLDGGTKSHRSIPYHLLHRGQGESISHTIDWLLILIY